MSDSQVEAIVDALHGAERPLIVAGTAAAYSGSGEELRRLVEATRAPIMTEAGARGLVPDDHPYCAGFYDNGLNDAARKLRDADVVLLLGMKQDIIIGYALPPTLSADTVVLQVDPSPAEIGRNRGVAVGIVGDVAAVADRIASSAASRSWPERPWVRELREVREAQLKEAGRARGQRDAHARDLRPQGAAVRTAPGRLPDLRGRRLLPLRPRLSPGPGAEVVALLLGGGYARLGPADRHGRQAGLSRTGGPYR